MPRIAIGPIFQLFYDISKKMYKNPSKSILKLKFRILRDIPN